jgi:hypothetical protein
VANSRGSVPSHVDKVDYVDTVDDVDAVPEFSSSMPSTESIMPFLCPGRYGVWLRIVAVFF